MAKRGLVALLATTAFTGCATTGYNSYGQNGSGPYGQPPAASQQTYPANGGSGYYAGAPQPAPAYNGMSKEPIASCNPAQIFKTVSAAKGQWSFGKDGCVYSMIDGNPLPLRNYNLQTEAGANAFNYEILNPGSIMGEAGGKGGGRMMQQLDRQAEQERRRMEQEQRRMEQGARREEQREYQRQRRCAYQGANALGQAMRGNFNPAYMIRGAANCMY